MARVAFGELVPCLAFKNCFLFRTSKAFWSKVERWERMWKVTKAKAEI